MLKDHLDRRAVLAGIVAVAALGGCQGRGDWLAFDVILRVDTPRGPASGRASLRAVYNKSSALLPGDVGSTTILGEAPFIELGNGQILVALLEAPYQRQKLLDLMFDAIRGGHAEPQLQDASNLWSDAVRLRPVVTLPASGLPMFVTFANVASPASVRAVEPGDFAMAFGQGYLLRDFQVVVTDGRDPEPARIEQALPWLNRPLEEPLDQVSAGGRELPLARTLYRTNFIKGQG